MIPRLRRLCGVRFLCCSFSAFSNASLQFLRKWYIVTDSYLVQEPPYHSGLVTRSPSRPPNFDIYSPRWWLNCGLAKKKKNSQGSPSLKKKWVSGLTFWEGRGMIPPLAMEFVLMVALVGSFWSSAD